MLKGEHLDVGDDSVSQVLVLQPEDLSSVSQNPFKKEARDVCLYSQHWGGRDRTCLSE